MSTSGGTSHRTRDRYEPEQAGVRNKAARDGYDPGDGFQRPNPQVWSKASEASQSSYLPLGGSYGYATNGTSRPRPRRLSTGGFDDYDDVKRRGSNGYAYGYSNTPGREYTTSRRNRSAPRGREYYPGDDSESDEGSFDYSDNERDRALTKRPRSSSRGRRRASSASRGGAARSQSGIRKKLQDMFGADDDDMGKDNSEGKKWAATVAGAVAGGIAARTAKKDNWVPAALGAILGGLTAREAEKMFYIRKDQRAKEMEAWDGKRGSKD